MKKIIIPTDFSVSSLSLLKYALERTTNEKNHIHLVHAVHLPTSISDLLFFNKNKFINEIKPAVFDDALSILENKYGSKISSIELDIYAGYNKNAFKNYIEAKNIEEAYIPANNIFQKPHTNSFNIIPLINKTIEKVTEVEIKNIIKIKEETFSENALLNLSV